MSSGSETELARILRTEGRKQRWLAAETGIHPTSLNHIVHGRSASDDDALAIARALGRTVDEVFPRAAA
jgi:plasmid maintenance system antidote protein VapI